MSVFERFERVRRSEGRLDSGGRGHAPRGRASRSLRAIVRDAKRDMLDRVGFAEVARLARDSDTRHSREELRPAVEAVINARDTGELSQEDREEVVVEVLDDVVGLGPLQPLIEDDSVTEIMVNGCMSTYFEQAGTLHAMGRLFDDDEQIRILIDRIISPLGSV